MSSIAVAPRGQGSTWETPAQAPIAAAPVLAVPATAPTDVFDPDD